MIRPNCQEIPKNQISIENKQITIKQKHLYKICKMLFLQNFLTDTFIFTESYFACEITNGILQCEMH